MCKRQRSLSTQEGAKIFQRLRESLQAVAVTDCSLIISTRHAGLSPTPSACTPPLNYKSLNRYRQAYLPNLLTSRYLSHFILGETRRLNNQQRYLKLNWRSSRGREGGWEEKKIATFYRGLAGYFFVIAKRETSPLNFPHHRRSGIFYPTDTLPSLHTAPPPRHSRSSKQTATKRLAEKIPPKCIILPLFALQVLTCNVTIETFNFLQCLYNLRKYGVFICIGRPTCLP